MNSYQKITKAQACNNTFLCVGIDPDPDRIPYQFNNFPNGIFEYLKFIIKATQDYVCAYKINFAFFEQFGSKGFEILENTLEIIPKTIPTIADAKRSDIANTAKFYAKSIYEHFRFDGVTLNPLLGRDSLDPFFCYQDKINFILILTSNPGAEDFQKIDINGKFLFEVVLEKALNWFYYENCGFVVGATKPDEFTKIRRTAFRNFILAPGVGAQGGDLEKILQINEEKPLIVNVSRNIIYPNTKNFSIDYLKENAKYYWKFLKRFPEK